MPKKDNPIIETQKSVKKETAPKRLRNLKARLFQAYLLSAIIIFIVLAIFAHFFPYFKPDLYITKTFQEFDFPWFFELMSFISYWGYNPQMPIFSSILVLYLYVIGFKWEAIVSAVNLLSAGFITGVLKTVVGRGRPPSELVNVVQNLHDNSFPSGHVLTYTAFYGFLFFLTYTLLVPSLFRKILLLIFGILILLVGPSRVYLGQHWTSDAFGAYLLGSIWLFMFVWIYRWGKPRFFVKQPLASSEKE